MLKAEDKFNPGKKLFSAQMEAFLCVTFKNCHPKMKARVKYWKDANDWDKKLPDPIPKTTGADGKKVKVPDPIRDTPFSIVDAGKE